MKHYISKVDVHLNLKYIYEACTLMTFYIIFNVFTNDLLKIMYLVMYFFQCLMSFHKTLILYHAWH